MGSPAQGPDPGARGPSDRGKNMNRPDTNCPSEEILCGFADGTLAEGRDGVEAHLAECERCLSTVAQFIRSARQLEGARLESPPLALERQLLGRSLAEDQPREDVPFLRRLAHAVFSYRTAAAIATVSVVALLAVWVGQQDRRPGKIPSAVREGPGYSQGPVLVEPEGPIAAQGSVRFHWEPCPRGEHYVITVLNADSGTVVIREAAASGEYFVTAELLIQSGGTHFEWIVECTLTDGRVVLSPAFAFELIRSPTEE